MDTTPMDGGLSMVRILFNKFSTTTLIIHRFSMNDCGQMWGEILMKSIKDKNFDKFKLAESMIVNFNREIPRESDHKI